MLDNKGSFYIMDAVLAIFLLLVVFLIVNTAISMSSSDYSYESRDIRTAQDVMELLSGKIDFTDNTFIGEISTVLEEGKNSKESVSRVSDISKNRLDSYNIKNYMFCENNVLDGKVLPWWCSLDNTWDCGSHSPGSNPGQGIYNFRDYYVEC